MKILYDLTATQPNWNAKMHGGGQLWNLSFSCVT
jgi:hypothetical protein